MRLPSTQQQMLKPPKATPQCLSKWRLSQLAMASANSPDAVTKAEQSHIGSCTECTSAWQHERQLVAVRRQEDLPAFLQAMVAAAPSRRVSLPAVRESKRAWFRFPAISMGLVGAAVAGVLWLNQPAPTGDERLKGASQLHASALRADKIIANDVPLEDLPALQDDDRLRLRVVTTHRWYSLWAREGKEWKSFGEGDVPKDGWLPIGLRFNGKNRSDMALLLCPQKPAAVSMNSSTKSKPKGCERVEFAL